MDQPQEIEPRVRHELVSALSELGDTMRNASDEQLTSINEALADVIRQAQDGLPGRMAAVEYDTVVAIAQLAIATGDPEALARVITRHVVGSTAESDIDLLTFHTKFPHVDAALVVGVRSGLRWLRGAAESLGMMSTLKNP